ncbi:MAG: hypothetical protein ISR50_16555, partial [Alphaproteobacteria bacterium]|nr:hypothetical protein [Alphaproteobacteria bacterium]
AQQRIDEVYADNAHPYFAKSGGRKGRLNAAMLRLNQVTAPPNRPQPGQQLISAAILPPNRRHRVERRDDIPARRRR